MKSQYVNENIFLFAKSIFCLSTHERTFAAIVTRLLLLQKNQDMLSNLVQLQVVFMVALNLCKRSLVVFCKKRFLNCLKGLF